MTKNYLAVAFATIATLTLSGIELAQARSAVDAISDIPAMVQYLTRKFKSEPILSETGRYVESGEDFVRFGDNIIGSPNHGNAMGDWDFVRIAQKGDAEILVTGETLRSANMTKSKLFIFNGLPSSERELSVAMAYGLRVTKKKLSARVEKAWANTVNNHPGVTNLEALIHKSDSSSIGFARNQREIYLTGDQYVLNIENLDPAIVEEFLTTLVRSINSMGRL